MPDDHKTFQAVNARIQEARETLGTDGSFRIRVLLEMLSIELARELTKAVPSGAPADPRKH